MSYWRLYYHFVWATREREPIITARVEERLFGYLIGKACAMNSIVHAVNAAGDHLHLVASIPPSVALSDFVARLKGSSSHDLNEALLNGSFAWQARYGVITFGERQLAWVVRYVREQKERHRDGAVVPALEKWEETIAAG